MKVLIFGATGMVGRGVLLEALDDPKVERVLSISRSSTGVAHPKLQEILKKDVTDLADASAALAQMDACFFCLGVTSVGLKEPEYTRLTYDLTLKVARELHAANPRAVFVYVSGTGTDSTEKGRTMWARVKGRTENAILALGFRAAYMFRPGLIKPERGVRSSTGWYHAFYVALSPLTALMVKTSKNATTTIRVGQAMLQVAERMPPGAIVEAPRINELAAERIARK